MCVRIFWIRPGSVEIPRLPRRHEIGAARNQQGHRPEAAYSPSTSRIE
jgi:hypothetical protein